MLKQVFSRNDLIPEFGLIRELVLKNLKVRYSRPALGFLWAFLSPFFTALIFYAVFSLVLKVQIEEAPFLLYLMSAVFPWSFFQDSIMSSLSSLVDNRNLIKESNLPHYLIPVSIVFTNAIVFLPSLLILVITVIFMAKGLPVFIIFLPAVFIIHLTITIGLSIIVSILYVKYRDIKYMVEILLPLLFYSTPIFYSISLIKTSFASSLFKIYIYNPFVGICNLYRAALFKGFYGFIQKDAGSLSIIASPIFFVGAIFISAILVYKKNKSNINDYLSY